MRRRAIGLAALWSVSMANTAGALCAGDCGGDRMVTVSELITGVNIALGGAVASQCPSVDGNGDGSVVVNELVSAVANALNGCPFLGQYGTRIDVGDGETALIRIQVATDGTATGTLSVGPTASSRKAALRIEIPLPLNLTGTVDLDSGAYHLTGSVTTSEGPVPVDVSGILPDRPGLNGTLDLDIGPEMFSGPIRTGNGDPTPTATATRPPASATPTFTPTAMPANFPTPGETCQDASFSLVFRDPNGVNSYADLSQGLNIGKGNLTLLPGVVFGGGAVPCTVNLGDIVRRVQLIAGPVSVGQSIPLGRARGQATFDYIETPVSNPLGTRGWRSDSGTLVIDHLDATSARFHIVNAVMSPEPSFSFQQPATGTFVIDAGAAGILTMVQ